MSWGYCILDDSQKDCPSASLANIINPIIVFFFFLSWHLDSLRSRPLCENNAAERLGKFPMKRFRWILKCQKAWAWFDFWTQNNSVDLHAEQDFMKVLEPNTFNKIVFYYQ